MLTSITPLGEWGRGHRFALTAPTYVVGSVLGGVTTGALLGALGSLGPVPPATALAVLAAACVLGLALDVRGRVPSWRRQVDERWLGRYRGWVYALGFGLQLGTGVVTIVTSTLTYAAWLVALLTGDVLVGAVLGATFGLVRALPIVLAARVRTPEDLRSLSVRIARREPLARRLSLFFLAFSGVVATVSAVLA